MTEIDWSVERTTDGKEWVLKEDAMAEIKKRDRNLKALEEKDDADDDGRLRQIGGQWTCDDLILKDGKHCRGQRWGCEYGDGKTCNFEKSTGHILYPACGYCEKPILGTPYKASGDTYFCNKECLDKDIKETDDALEQEELDEIYGEDE